MQLIQLEQDRIPTAANMQTFTAQGPNSATRNDAMSIWYDPSQCNDTTPRVGLGSWWFDDTTGNSYQYIRATAALLIGQLVAQAAPATDTVSATAADFSTVTLVTGGLTVNAEVGNYVFFTGATAGGTSGASSLYVQAMRKIKANTASVLTLALKNYSASSLPLDGDQLHAAPTNATAVSIIRPFYMAVGTATTPPVGVAIGSTAINDYCMVQKSGLALVQGIGSGTAIVVNQLAVPGAAGTILGGTPGQYNGAATINPMFAFAGAANTLIPCMVNFFGA